MKHSKVFSFVYATLFFLSGLSWAHEGLSEDCSLDFYAQCKLAESIMEYNARKSCSPKSARQKLKTQFDRYLINCPNDPHVFGVAATAEFDCWSPF